MMHPRPRSTSSQLFSLQLSGSSAALATGTALCLLLSCGGSSDKRTEGGNNATGGNNAGGALPTSGQSGKDEAAGVAGVRASQGGASGSDAGNGGITTGGSSGGNAAGGTSSSGGGATTGGSGGASVRGQCPSDASFCSGFEDASLPAALKLVDYNAQGLPTLDGTVHNSGNQSVTIGPKAGGGEMYLEAPASQSFWFRVYVRTDNGFTHNEHDAFMSLAWAGDDKGVEVVEENCMLTVNDHDKTWGSNGMMMQAGCHTDGVRLDANKWYCLEGFADGGNGDLQIYVGGTPAIQISANATLKHPYETFRFGYREYNGVDRSTWYDDIAVAPNRIGCLP